MKTPTNLFRSVLAVNGEARVPYNRLHPSLTILSHISSCPVLVDLKVDHIPDIEFLFHCHFPPRFLCYFARHEHPGQRRPSRPLLAGQGTPDRSRALHDGSFREQEFRKRALHRDRLRRVQEGERTPVGSEPAELPSGGQRRERMRKRMSTSELAVSTIDNSETYIQNSVPALKMV
jgi:hypothetical protein